MINVHLSKKYMCSTCYTRTWGMRSQCAPSSPNLSHMLTTPFPIHTVHLQAREQNRVFSGASARTWVLAPAHHSGPVCDVNNTVQRLSRPKPPEPEPELPIAMPAAVPTAAGKLPRWQSRVCRRCVRRAQSGRARWPVGGRAAPGRAVRRGRSVCVCAGRRRTRSN